MASRGAAWCGMVRAFGPVWYGRVGQCEIGLGKLRSGRVWFATAWPGVAWFGWVWSGRARHGVLGCDQARPGRVRCGAVRHGPKGRRGSVQSGVLCSGLARYGQLRWGELRPGAVGSGRSSFGMAWFGRLGSGKLWRGCGQRCQDAVRFFFICLRFGAISAKMTRSRLRDFLVSRGPATLGLCESDVAGCAKIVNAAQQRLLFAKETSDTGFWGAWGRIAFNLSRTSPTFTAPREVGRLIALDVCKYPVAVQNEFYEFLEFGVGYQPRNTLGESDRCGRFQAYDRGVVPTFTDLTPPNKTIRVYPSDPADAGTRTLIAGLDNNDQKLTSLDGPVQVQGVYVTLALPFADLVVPGTMTQIEISRVTAIQKDTTLGAVSYYEVDLTTGAQSLLLIMEPGEQTAGYRRYFVNGLPTTCCPTVPATTTVQVNALAKLELIPVRVDSDYLLVQNIEALIAECQSIRYSEIDGGGAKQQAQERHIQAIRLLQGELIHYEGKDRPAINFAPFGNARLSCVKVGTCF